MPKKLFTLLNKRNEWVIASQVMLSSLPIFATGILIDRIHLSIAAILGIVCVSIAQLQSQYPHANHLQKLVTLCCFLFIGVGTLLLYEHPIVLRVSLCIITLIFIFLSTIAPQRFAGVGFTSILFAIYMLWGMRVFKQAELLLLWLFFGAIVFYIVNALWEKYSGHYRQLASLANCYSDFAQLFDSIAQCFQSTEKERYHCNQQQCYTHQQLYATLQNTRFLLKQKRSDIYSYLYLQTQELYQITIPLMSEALKTKNAPDSMTAQSLYQFSQSCQLITKALKGTVRLIEPPTMQPAPTLSSPLAQTLHHCKHQLKEIHELILNSDSPHDINLPKAQQKITSSKTLWQQLIQACDWQTQALRYALRLSFGLGICFIASLYSPWPNPEWLLISFWLVCRPSYSATRRRFVERTAGTFFGLTCSIPCLSFLEYTPQLQLIIILLCLTFFFVFIEISYVKAVFFITLFVIFAYDLVNNQVQDIVIPRMIYTILGTGIAWFVTFFLWPQWQKGKIPEQIDACLAANIKFFDAVIEHSDEQKRCFYKALDKHQQLVATWQDMKGEPKSKRGPLQRIFNLTQLNLEMITNITLEYKNPEQIALTAQEIRDLYEDLNNLLQTEKPGDINFSQFPEKYKHLLIITKKLHTQSLEIKSHLITKNNATLTSTNQ